MQTNKGFWNKFLKCDDIFSTAVIVLTCDNQFKLIQLKISC